MPYFDRLDICAAYALLEHDYNMGGILRERPSCDRRNRGYGESVSRQLSRIGYRHPVTFQYRYEDLSDNARAIYNQFRRKHFPYDPAEIAELAEELKEFSDAC